MISNSSLPNQSAYIERYRESPIASHMIQPMPPVQTSEEDVGDLFARVCKTNEITINEYHLLKTRHAEVLTYLKTCHIDQEDDPFGWILLFRDVLTHNGKFAKIHSMEQLRELADARTYNTLVKNTFTLVELLKIILHPLNCFAERFWHPANLQLKDLAKSADDSATHSQHSQHSRHSYQSYHVLAMYYYAYFRHLNHEWDLCFHYLDQARIAGYRQAYITVYSMVSDSRMADSQYIDAHGLAWIHLPEEKRKFYWSHMKLLYIERENEHYRRVIAELRAVKAIDNRSTKDMALLADVRGVIGEYL